ncbi:MAG: dihydrodipicolinate synthase family protein, partial [Propionibacteriaceae bacterium]|nr:dihydrodipicolinate synthase family protein [Propionibacteriaceae bacterium]
SGIDGLKVSAAASTRVSEYLAAAPAGFKLWSGNDADVPNVMAAGGTGTVSGVSGACPAPWAVLREAMIAGDDAGVERAQQVITQVVSVLGPSISALKAALDLQGLAGGHCRMAIDTPNDLVQSQISDVVDLVASFETEEKI